ncbi:hypothetical protein BDB01DRAFT_730974 [Pilobolus umbonatus]|nr:hypothetical protein BDB01DRAFT_730974 [Pilobolus umbonatus]
MCLVNGIMYIWGGQYHDEFLNDLCTFNLKSYPTTAEWNCSYFENQGPAPRAGHIGKIYNNRLYIFGGNSQNTLCNDMWYLDLNTYNWYHIETTGRIPPPRHCCGAALVDDTIYIFGGIGSNNNCLNDLYAFRIRSGRWYMLTNIGLPPSPRYGLTLTAIDKKLYLFGGESKTGKAEDASYVFILDCCKPSHFPQNKTVKNDKQRQVAPDTNQRYSEDSLDPITAEKEISYMDPVEKKRMIREIMARDILISEMRKKEQWWRTEVSLARMLRSQQGEIFEEPELSEADLISFGKKGSIDELGRDRVMLSNQLVNAKAEIRKLRSHLYKQMEPLSVKLDHAESIRTAALEEASYYRIKYAALKSADFDTFQQLETEREAVLEERLGMALEEKNEIEQTILKIRNQSEYDQSARLLVEERARISQLQSEEAQDAHQNILKELSDMYDTTLITESKVREDAVYIAQLSNQLARRLSSDAENNDNESERNMHIVQLESENIKLRNQLAVLSHQLEQSIDEQENLKAVLSEEDQSYATALLDIEKSIIELDLLKQASLQAQE